MSDTGLLNNARLILRLRNAGKKLKRKADLEAHVSLKRIVKEDFRFLGHIQPHYLDWDKFIRVLERKLGIEYQPGVTEIIWTDISFFEKHSPRHKWIGDEADFHDAITVMYNQRPHRSDLKFVLNIYSPPPDEDLKGRFVRLSVS